MADKPVKHGEIVEMSAKEFYRQMIALQKEILVVIKKLGKTK